MLWPSASIPWVGLHEYTNYMYPPRSLYLLDLKRRKHILESHCIMRYAFIHPETHRTMINILSRIAASTFSQWTNSTRFQTTRATNVLHHFYFVCRQNVAWHICVTSEGRVTSPLATFIKVFFPPPPQLRTQVILTASLYFGCFSLSCIIYCDVLGSFFLSVFWSNMLGDGDPHNLM